MWILWYTQEVLPLSCLYEGAVQTAKRTRLLPIFFLYRPKGQPNPQSGKSWSRLLVQHWSSPPAHCLLPDCESPTLSEHTPQHSIPRVAAVTVRWAGEVWWFLPNRVTIKNYLSPLYPCGPRFQALSVLADIAKMDLIQVILYFGVYLFCWMLNYLEVKHFNFVFIFISIFFWKWNILELQKLLWPGICSIHKAFPSPLWGVTPVYSEGPSMKDLKAKTPTFFSSECKRQGAGVRH